MLRDYEDELDESIESLVDLQDASNTDSLKRIQTAKADMVDLFRTIDDVRERALKTEQIIVNMTADIKQLDNTKRNLTLSMTALKQLQMLTTAYDQLKVLNKTRQYRECSQLLQAVIQLMVHFKSYRSIDQIAILNRNVSDIQRELLEQVCEDFELVFSREELPQKQGILAEGCLVLDALGDAAKSRLITWYCNTQLREYRTVFRATEEAGSLDNISRRYAWFKRMLWIYDEAHAPIFPPSWQVAAILANVFCEGTREDFKGILSRSFRNRQSLDINLLLSCLQETLDFEHYLERKFASSSSRVSTDTFISTSNEPSVFNPSISEAFGPYLNIWVQAQDKLLSTLIPKYKKENIKPPDEEFTPQMVIHSSIDLFTVYRHSLAKCAKLSSGASLSELSKVFAKYLDQYAQQVLLPYIGERPNSQIIPKKQPTENLIMVLNTADYCFTTSNQLEEKIKSRVDDSLKDSIDFQSQADAFMGIMSSCIRGLVRNFEVIMEPAWKEMRNMAWNKLDSAGDTSSYVGILLEVVKEESQKLLPLLHKPQHSRGFADHLVESISTSFVQNISQCKPVSETGAEQVLYYSVSDSIVTNIRQMLLDSYTLKEGLSSLISPAPTGFTKRLGIVFQKIDTLLKTLQVRPVPSEAFVQAYLLHIGDKSDANFRKVLDIKGIRNKSDQNRLLEMFQFHRDSSLHSSNLEQSNPLITHLQSSVASSSASSNIAAVAPSSAAPGISFPYLSSGDFINSASADDPNNTNNGGRINDQPRRSLSPGALPGRFDPPSIGSVLLSAARDGVGIVPSPSAVVSGFGGLSGIGGVGSGSTGSRAATPILTETIPATSGANTGVGTGLGIGLRSNTTSPEPGANSTVENVNKNINRFGKFFRRDLGGLGSRFTRGNDDGPGK